MPLQKLSQVASTYCGGRDDIAPKVVRTYRWTEFAGKENTTEFDENHFKVEGHFESNSSRAHKEFQDRIRVIHFRKEGKTKGDIAKLLGRSEKFVAKWWQKDEKELPRPWGVHEYLTKEMGQKTFNTPATVSKETASSTAAWWRDVEVRRKYHDDPSIYDEILQSTEWNSGVARTRDFGTGASHLKYDKEGKLKMQSNQSARYVQGQSPAMDRLLQKFFAEYGIADRTSGISLNWYPDGDAALGSHRHDCWTALFSFGHERILTIDKTPLLCQDCDLVIFGTQRHGVPLMPEIQEGRITVPIFFYPDHLQMKQQWHTLTDPEDPRISRTFAKLEHEHSLGSAADDVFWDDPGRASKVDRLLELGFGVDCARVALVACKFDTARAVEALLLTEESALIDLVDDPLPQAAAITGVTGGSEVCNIGRWKARSIGAVSDKLVPAAELGGELTSVERAACAILDDGISDTDVAFALKLQLGEFEETQPIVSSCDDIETSAVLAAQLEEEEHMRDVEVALGTGLLQAQFDEYEEQFKRDDAEEWHGHGDLMQRGLARETLSLSTMDKTTCYSLGHGRISERDFYELLSLNSIRVLYDFRASDYRGDIHSPCTHFSVHSLKSACKARGIRFKHVALGREGAYGILHHISSDEAQHSLIELVWHAKRSRAAFLGYEEDWRMDHRQVIAEELVKAGHSVEHILGHGATEAHPKGRAFPDFILQEEEKIRKIEKMRRAGELKRPEKSAVDRSAEVIARQLCRPPEVIDAMTEMRRASNQTELEQVQKKLARVQRIATQKDSLANKVLTNTPHWVIEEAKAQESWIATKKVEKQAALVANASNPNARCATKGSQPEVNDALRVECAGCGIDFEWTQLALGDGLCGACIRSDSSNGEFAQGGSSEIEESLLVECARCNAMASWQVLQYGDGTCPTCCKEPTEVSRSVETCDSSASSSHAPRGSLADSESVAPPGSCSSGDLIGAQECRSTWRSRRRATAVVN